MQIRVRHLRGVWKCIESFVSILMSVAMLLLPINFSFLTTTALASSSERIIPINSMVVAREGHTATVLTNGWVLITGGTDSNNAVLASVEIFAPTTNVFRAVASMNIARVGHTATRMLDGRVLVAGGDAAGTAEIFDPTTETFSELPTLMTTARSGHSATRMLDGRVLIAGGDAAATAELFDPVTETFTHVGGMTEARSGHSATLFADNSVFLAGGGTDSAEFLDTNTLSFTLSPNRMTVARIGHTAIDTEDAKLVLFGGDAGNTVERFDPLTESFSVAATLPSSSASALLLANEKILVLGPELAGVFAPSTDQLASLTNATLLQRSGHTATELSTANKTILVAGGVNSSNEFVGTAALFNPAHVETDLDDYPPGATVYITGGGFLPNEQVELQVLHAGYVDADGVIHEDPLLDNNGEGHFHWNTQADAYGDLFDVTWVVCEDDCAGALLELTATGQTSGLKAQTRFTDGSVKARSNASGITFTLIWRTFTNVVCSGTQSDSNTVTGVGFSGGAQFNKGVAASDSITLQAASTSDQGGAFLYWTRDGDASFTNSAFTICVPGNFTGTRIFAANYAACTLTCPANILTNTSGQCGRSVTYSAPTTGGSCGTVTCTPASGSFFSVGTTAVTCTSVTTGASCSFTVMVNDTENPTISCPSNIATTNDTGLCSAVVLYTAPVGTDNCLGSSTVQSGGLASGSAFPVGVTTNSFEVTDAYGNTNSCSFTVTVNDTERPVPGCPGNIDVSAATGQCSSNVSFSVTASDNCDLSPTVACVPPSGSTFLVGSSNVVCAVTDVAGNSSNCTFSVTVNKRPTTLLYGGDTAGQYSDPVKLKATLTDNETSAAITNKTVTFTLCSNSTVLASVTALTDSNGMAMASLTLSNAPGSYTIKSAFAGDCGYAASSDSDSFTINCEDARAYYTGCRFAVTASPSSPSAPVLLSATIKDITAVDPSLSPPYPDNYGGDIRNATVCFVIEELNQTFTVPVSLLDPANTLVGTVATNITVVIPNNADAVSYTVRVDVKNYYCGVVDSESSVALMVAKPRPGMVTGGGYLVLQTSQGIKKGDAGSKNNLGFNIKNSKTLNNLQGNLNTIIRRTEGGVPKLYQIKSNAMGTLATQTPIDGPTPTTPWTAQFSGKCNVKDVTNPLNPISVAGGLTFKVTLTDKGEPGSDGTSADTWGLTVWDGSALYYSSSWNGTATGEQQIIGGNLKIHK